MPLINSEIELNFPWSKKSILSGMSITPRVVGHSDAIPAVPEVVAIQKTGPIFQINNANFYVPVATLSINDNIKFLEKNNFSEQI